MAPQVTRTYNVPGIELSTQLISEMSKCPNEKMSLRRALRQLQPVGPNVASFPGCEKRAHFCGLGMRLGPAVSADYNLLSVATYGKPGRALSHLHSTLLEPYPLTVYYLASWTVSTYSVGGARA